ncbi:hypothetical protein [Planococcus sp. ISL-109]|uniref:hypothetical protein n=1 Tax=Planococcus sp. ISL-109 TaxID=2819166 RepID=UPI001BE99982|nr:hypothetical protein [Planococcus sp. ISL-109]MBT2581536.1 hypothetical protein [Planococcus sp. ISL-109]
MMEDLYFDKRYGKLNEEIEKGVCQVFEFNHRLGHVRHMFIKREIPILLGAERYFYNRPALWLWWTAGDGLYTGTEPGRSWRRL